MIFSCHRHFNWFRKIIKHALLWNFKYINFYFKCVSYNLARFGSTLDNLLKYHISFDLEMTVSQMIYIRNVHHISHINLFIF